MKNIIKYGSMFMLSFLQMYYAVEQLNDITSITQTIVIILISIAIYNILFVTYSLLLVFGKLKQRQINIFENFLVMIGFILSLGIFSSYVSNTWIWQESNFQLVLLEMWKFIIMLLSSIVTLISHFWLKQRYDVEDKTLWNTYNTMDGLFFIISIITAFGVGTATSKIIPYTTRNYYVYLRIALIFIYLGILWGQSLLFSKNRNIFYAAILGYIGASISELGEYLFLLSPLLKQQFLSANMDTMRITVMNVFIMINAFILIVWFAWCYFRERKSQIAS